MPFSFKKASFGSKRIKSGSSHRAQPGLSENRHSCPRGIKPEGKTLPFLGRVCLPRIAKPISQCKTSFRFIVWAKIAVNRISYPEETEKKQLAPVKTPGAKSGVDSRFHGIAAKPEKRKAFSSLPSFVAYLTPLRFLLSTPF